MRRILIALLLMSCVICAGCFEVKFGLTITESGAVIQQSKFTATAALARQIEAWKNQVEMNNPNVKAKAVEKGDLRGYKFVETYPDIETFTKYAGDLYAAHVDKNEGISRHKGWFFDQYDFDLYWKSSSAQTTFDATVNQALLSQAVFDVEINLPYAIETTNADEISVDGKYLKWHLAHVAINGGEKYMNARFKIWHKDKIALTAVAEIILLAATIFFFIKARSETLEKAAKDLRFKRNVFAALFLVLGITSLYLILKSIS